jgi:hypothetical protein
MFLLWPTILLSSECADEEDGTASLLINKKVPPESTGGT